MPKIFHVNKKSRPSYNDVTYNVAHIPYSHFSQIMTFQHSYCDWVAWQVLEITIWCPMSTNSPKSAQKDGLKKGVRTKIDSSIQFYTYICTVYFFSYFLIDFCFGQTYHRVIDTHSIEMQSLLKVFKYILQNLAQNWFRTFLIVKR